MTNITYNINEVEHSLSCELPEMFYCRLDWNSYALIDTFLDSDCIDDFPKDMYHFTEVSSTQDPLFAFIALYRDSLIEKTLELNTTYDEIREYYDPRAYKIEPDSVVYEAFYSNHKINEEVLDDYVPPLKTLETIDPALAEPLEGAVGDKIIDVPPVNPE
jgi:hypothetical protein